MKIRCLIIIFFCLLASCNSISINNEETEFVSQLIDPNTKDINTSLKLSLHPNIKNSFNIEEITTLYITNQSDMEIFIPPGTTVQLLSRDENEKKWDSIENRVKYSGDGVTIFPTGTNKLSSTVIVVQPSFLDPKETEKVRIAVTGYIVKDGQVSQEPVSAFLDVTLKKGK